MASFYKFDERVKLAIRGRSNMPIGFTLFYNISIINTYASLPIQHICIDFFLKMYYHDFTGKYILYRIRG